MNSAGRGEGVGPCLLYMLSRQAALVLVSTTLPVRETRSTVKHGLRASMGVWKPETLKKGHHCLLEWLSWSGDRRWRLLGDVSCRRTVA